MDQVHAQDDSGRNDRGMENGKVETRDANYCSACRHLDSRPEEAESCAAAHNYRNDETDQEKGTCDVEMDLVGAETFTGQKVSWSQTHN